MMEAEAALGCLGDGDCDGQGEIPGQGQGGTGGEGQGRGGAPLENRTATTFQDEFSESQLNRGTILNQLFVKGVPERGEATSEYADVARAARQHAASSLAQDKIPREYEEMVKKYFDTIESTDTE